MAEAQTEEKKDNKLVPLIGAFIGGFIFFFSMLGMVSTGSPNDPFLNRIGFSMELILSLLELLILVGFVALVVLIISEVNARRRELLTKHPEPPDEEAPRRERAETPAETPKETEKEPEKPTINYNAILSDLRSQENKMVKALTMLINNTKEEESVGPQYVTLLQQPDKDKATEKIFAGITTNLEKIFKKQKDAMDTIVVTMDAIKMVVQPVPEYQGFIPGQDEPVKEVHKLFLDKDAQFKTAKEGYLPTVRALRAKSEEVLALTAGFIQQLDQRLK